MARGKARKRFTDLKDMFFINDQSIGAPKARFQGGMRIHDRLHPLIAAGGGEVLSFFLCSGPDKAPPCGSAPHLSGIAHSREAGHGRAFDMLGRARAAPGGPLPPTR